jgi:cell division protein FtsA
MTNIYAALEIGTSRTVLAVAEANTGGRLKLSCCSAVPSTGVHKSRILQIDQATSSIRSALEDCGRQRNDLSIANAFLVVSGDHVKTHEIKGSAPIENRRVSPRDVENVLNDTRATKFGKDRELVGFEDQGYAVDSLDGIEDPCGMSGNTLWLNTLALHADANCIDNARTAAGNAHLELRDPLFAVACAGESVLTQDDRKNGTLVIDFGGGTTGYALYLNGYMVFANAIGVGGEHVTNDIAHAFQLSQKQAERLKIESSCAVIGFNEPDVPRIRLHGDSPLVETRTVSRNALDTVVNARLHELVGIVRDDLEAHELLHRIKNVVLTGGGAAMRGLSNLVQAEINPAVKLGVPLHVDGIEALPNPESFAAVAGALLYGHNNYEERSILQKFMGMFK